MSPQVRVEWRHRQTPLSPCAAVALGEVADRLGRRLLAHCESSSSQLRAIGSKGLLCVIGDCDDLPWVDGLVYLGRDPRAPSLRVPTLFEPTLDLQLVERALLGRARASDIEPPLAMTLAPPRLFSLAHAQRVSAAGLRVWLEQP